MGYPTGPPTRSVGASRAFEPRPATPTPPSGTRTKARRSTPSGKAAATILVNGRVLGVKDPGDNPEVLPVAHSGDDLSSS